MKIFHLSDLHIGKRVNDFPMIDDQEYILNQIITEIDSEKPSVIIIAGDIYDKAVPSTEAIQLFDSFLVKLSSRNLQVFIISGNHDSPERIAFASRLIEQSGIHLSPVYNGNIKPITLLDEFGEINIHMLPFIKPIQVRALFPDKQITTYSEAIKCAVDELNVDSSKRNILITHQFVTGAKRCDSEEISIGGSDNVDAAVFDCFDYVALGHIHGPQNIISNKIRYCGTPIKYSFSEISHNNSITMIELKEKGVLDLKEIALIPKINWMEIKGNYLELVSKSFYSKFDQNSYMHVILTDEDDIPDAIGKLRVIYPNLMKLDYDNSRTKTNNVIDGNKSVENKSPNELFANFYLKQNNKALSLEQTKYIESLVELIWSRKNETY